jgi:hypothetical protein
VYASVNPELAVAVIEVADAFPLYVAVPFVSAMVNAAPEMFWNSQNAPAVMPDMEAGSVMPVMPVLVI